MADTEPIHFITWDARALFPGDFTDGEIDHDLAQRFQQQLREGIANSAGAFVLPGPEPHQAVIAFAATAQRVPKVW